MVLKHSFEVIVSPVEHTAQDISQFNNLFTTMYDIMSCGGFDMEMVTITTLKRNLHKCSIS